ncbi:MAG: TIGR00300 family protein, partial [Nitrospira sp. SB0672_bin_25]|nr:TIGR00300 family protein [Nitrospira sp. SB0672_bin_25]
MATETVILEGHVIDSLILAKVLDTILQRSGTFTINEMHVGATREDASSARIAVHADSSPRLAAILHAIQPHGAVVEHATDCTLEPAPKDGVLPDSFYATSHLRTQIRLNCQWLDVEAIEMDLAVRVTLDPPAARAIPMAEVKAGDLIVTGRTG